MPNFSKFIVTLVKLDIRGFFKKFCYERLPYARTIIMYASLILCINILHSIMLCINHPDSDIPVTFVY